MALQSRDAFVMGDKKEIIEENGVDTLDTPKAIFKGKMAEQIASLLPGTLTSCNPADARFHWLAHRLHLQEHEQGKELG